uniref:Uncharacterized protein n=1 Tax=Ananas comosus var. bracteatus TaxID=296719 RepID=A0A6V7Q7F3_ANACO|nr:unnamed protein product [Ananas comosus var. bracteatus]
MAISEPGPLAAEPNRIPFAVAFGRPSFLDRSLGAAIVSSGHWTVRVADPSPSPAPAHQPTIGATKTLISAAIECGVRRVVCTGSAAIECSATSPCPTPISMRTFWTSRGRRWR